MSLYLFSRVLTHTTWSLISLIALQSFAQSSAPAASATQETVTKTAIAPPPLIAPTGLMSQEDLMLPPDQALAKEKAYKSQADNEYNRGDYRKALVSLQRAYLISKKARYVANQGLVLEKMQRYSDAIKALEYYLHTNPPAEMARSAQLVIHRLRPEIKIETDPPGAQVMVNKETLGLTPLTFRLMAGEHPLELNLQGYDQRKVTLFVLPGKPVFAQYKLDQSAQTFNIEPKLSTDPIQTRPDMNSWQSSGMVLGGLTLGLSLASFWYTRAAIIDRNNALNQTSWEVAQSEAQLFNSLSYTSAGIGLSAVVGALSWWLLSDPPTKPTPYMRRKAQLEQRAWVF